MHKPSLSRVEIPMFGIAVRQLPWYFASWLIAIPILVGTVLIGCSGDPASSSMDGSGPGATEAPLGITGATPAPTSVAASTLPGAPDGDNAHCRPAYCSNPVVGRRPYSPVVPDRDTASRRRHHGPSPNVYRHPNSPGNRDRDNACRRYRIRGRFTSVSAGFSHTCTVRLDSSVECWDQTNYTETSLVKPRRRTARSSRSAPAQDTAAG